MRIGFLLGSGVSIPAGLPCTQQLTTAVRDFNRWERYPGDSSFRHRCDARWSLASRFGKLSLPKGLPWFLRTLDAECQNYFDEVEKPRRVNYEDLYYAASQIYEHSSDEYENPVLERFARALFDARRSLKSRSQLSALAQFACEYIVDVVNIELSRTPAWLGHLNCVVEAIRDLEFESCSIFTLNHDLLIERVLAEESIGYSLGFGEPSREVALWEPEVFARSSSRCSLLKLHGSLDWLPYGYDLLRFTGRDAGRAKTSGREINLSRGRARILVGTFNKIRDYTSPPFLDLLVEFRRQLQETDWLIVSGYSFGDKGVNAVLDRWLWSRQESGLLVLDEQGEACISQARGVIQHCWSELGDQRFFVHPAYLNNCSWCWLRQQYKIEPRPAPSR